MLNANGVSEIFADGTTVYLPTGEGLTIIDTANLDSIQYTNLWLNGYYNKVKAKQDTAYALSGLWDQTTVLSTIDVTDPLAPSVLGELILDGYTIDLSIAEQGGI